MESRGTGKYSKQEASKEKVGDEQSRREYYEGRHTTKRGGKSKKKKYIYSELYMRQA